MMEIVIDEIQIRSLGDEELVRACMIPVLDKLKGQPAAVKAEAYAQLNEAQRALFMYHVLHGHAYGGMEPFYIWLSHLAMEPKTVPELEKGYLFFGGAQMGEIVREAIHLAKSVSAQRQGDPSVRDWKRVPTLQRDFERLYEAYVQAYPSYVGGMARYIRQHPEMFVRFG